MLVTINVHIDGDTPIKADVFADTAAVTIDTVTLFIRNAEDAGRLLDAINEAISKQVRGRMAPPESVTTDGTSPQLAQYQAEGR